LLRQIGLERLVGNESLSNTRLLPRSLDQLVLCSLIVAFFVVCVVSDTPVPLSVCRWAESSYHRPISWPSLLLEASLQTRYSSALFGQCPLHCPPTCPCITRLVQPDDAGLGLLRCLVQHSGHGEVGSLCKCLGREESHVNLWHWTIVLRPESFGKRKRRRSQ